MNAMGAILDSVALQKLVDFFGFKNIVEGVVKRAQEGIDFLLNRAGQKAQPLARLHRGPA